MGNRAVITTKENFDNNGIGVYLHWNGGRDSVNAFLTYCKMKGFRAPEKDNYGWARLVQVIANFFGGSLSIGIDDVCYLDCDNGDKAVDLLTDYKEMLERYDENEPLRYSDLKEMFHKPVWIETNVKKGWNIIVSIDNTHMQVIHTAHRGPKLSGFTRDSLGTTWIAYRKERE